MKEKVQITSKTPVYSFWGERSRKDKRNNTSTLIEYVAIHDSWSSRMEKRSENKRKEKKERKIQERNIDLQ